MIKFKRGDKVEIRDCPALRLWGRGSEIVGETGIITYAGEDYLIIDDNKYGINFTDEMLILIPREDMRTI